MIENILREGTRSNGIYPLKIRAMLISTPVPTSTEWKLALGTISFV